MNAYELADDLAPAYLSAIEYAKQFAGKTWNVGLSMPMGPHRWRRHVRFLRERELTDNDIRFGVHALTKEPETLVYLGLDDAEQGLTEGAPAEWLGRTGLGTPDGRLVLRALFALAWIERHAKIETMLGTQAVGD